VAAGQEAQLERQQPQRVCLGVQAGVVGAASRTNRRAARSAGSRSASCAAVPGSGTASGRAGWRRNGLTLGQMKYGTTRPAWSSRSL
jgi:hypothetical protein